MIIVVHSRQYYLFQGLISRYTRLGYCSVMPKNTPAEPRLQSENGLWLFMHADGFLCKTLDNV